ALGPMPRDPIASCKPDRKGMKVIHQASLLLPELMPKLLTFMAASPELPREEPLQKGQAVGSTV
ncbi:unnamed protein product, partial [Symbiodinium necroappetens]